MIDPVEVMARAIFAEAVVKFGSHEPYSVFVDEMHAQARAALTAASEAGWVLVPREATEAMIDAGWEVLPFAPGTETHRMAGGVSPVNMWAAMIAAASEAGKEGE